MARPKSPYKAAPVKTRRAIDAYYRALKDFEFQGALHEGAVSTAFQTLLTEVGRKYKWTLIPQLGAKEQGHQIRPDGTLKDQMLLVRGHWEAKDTDDDLEVEIKKKIDKGYPTGNIVFEDTQTAVLIQNGNETLRADLTDQDQVVRVLEAFFAHIEPQIESFEKAVDEFKERVPELAKALKAKIEEAHRTNKPFRDAFAAFFQLCQASLNPDISKDAIDDMLVQHLLTERLIREVFDNPEFTRRNVIAVEIEKVILALTQKAFNRAEFLRSLDRFYVAIENAARTITDWSDKQHFLNTVYERFFQGYSVKLADTMGIVYTPQPIVDFMCASVAEVLEKEFGKKLDSRDVNILDPCTGTGNFIVNLMRRIPKRTLRRMYREQLFANEIMLLPYYIAALNIEHAYYDQTGEYESFEGLCFVDTLDLAESAQATMSFMTERNTERVERQKRTPITVIIGNPPYSQHQDRENDNNRNRSYEVIDRRIAQTYAKDSTANNKQALGDAYVRFFRWASDRIGKTQGIVCFVSNNFFLRGLAADGFRKHLQSDFDLIYHFDCKGNARTSGEQRRREGGNVFNDMIRTGVGITVLARVQTANRKRLFYHEMADYLRSHEKQTQISELASVGGIEWRRLDPTHTGAWLQSDSNDEFRRLLPLGTKRSADRTEVREGFVFKTCSQGAKTNRDPVVYDFSRDALDGKLREFIERYNAEVDRYRRSGRPKNVDDFVSLVGITWSRDLKKDLQRERYAHHNLARFRLCMYRPFSFRWLYYDPLVCEEVYQLPAAFPLDHEGSSNSLICCTNVGSEKPFMVLACDDLVDVHLVGAGSGTMCFPFFVYDEDGSHKWENITDWALEQFRSNYRNNRITKWDIFHYVYGILHHPGYREKFADNLKRELPRIPFAPEFRSFAKAGKRLAELHLGYEDMDGWPLDWYEYEGVPLSYRVEKMKLSKDKKELHVNESLTLGGIPPEVFEYRLGNRSALEWVIDQYRIKTDKRSGIVSDPNREDDPEYIVRLIGQVVRVSVETVKIVNSLPEEFSS